METIIFRGKMPDDVHFFNAALVKTLHSYNVQCNEADLASDGIVFAPVHEMCDITKKPVCIGLVASGKNVLEGIDLPPKLKAAFTAQRLPVTEGETHNAITISRVNLKSKGNFERHRDFLINQKGVPEKEATEAARQKRKNNQRRKMGLPFFWYNSAKKEAQLAIYVRATPSKEAQHKTHNTLGMGTTFFHPRIAELNGKVMLNQ